MIIVRKKVFVALSLLALASILLTGCGGKSEETSAASKDGAMSGKEGGATPAPGTTPAAPGAAPAGAGSLANPQPPEGSTK